MKLLKKLSLFAVCMVIAASALVACGGAKVKLDIVSSETGEIIKTFNEKAGASITYEPEVEDGLRFDGYYQDKELEILLYKTLTKMPDKDMTIYAKFTQLSMYEIKFDSKGGSAVSSISGFEGTKITAPADPTRNGYIFDGWYLNDVKYVFDTMPNETITLVAHWREDDSKSYITFVAGDFTETKIIDKGGKVTAADYSVAGYTLEGWYASIGDVDKFDFNSEIDTNLTIYGNIYSNGLEIDADTVTRYQGNANTVTMPWVYSGNIVKIIDTGAFMGNSTMRIANLPAKLETLEVSAFYMCTALETVALPDTLVTIGKNAFLGCAALKSITIPKNVTTLNINDAFENCNNLQSINFHADNELYSSFNGGVYTKDFTEFLMTAPGATTYTIRPNTEKMAKDSVKSTKLTSLMIPNSVTDIAVGAINTSTGNLATLTMPAVANSTYSVNSNQISIFNLAAVFGAESYRDNCTYNSQGQITKLSIYVPTSLKTVNITHYARTTNLAYTFFGCEHIENITLPTNGQLLKIDNMAFAFCLNLKEIVIPDSVTDIAGGSTNGAFIYTQSLTSYTAPFIGGSSYSTANNFMAYIFGANRYTDNYITSSTDYSLVVPLKLETITITGTGITEVVDGAFCAFPGTKTITLPNTIKSIGINAFVRCESLETLTGLENVEELKNTEGYSGAFGYTFSLKSLTLNLKRGIIGDGAFLFMSGLAGTLESFVIGEGVTAIGQLAFAGIESLKTLTLPSTLTSIGEQAFNGCGSLQELVIPASVISIGDGVFVGCDSLKSLTMPMLKNYPRLDELEGSEVQDTFGLSIYFGAARLGGNIYTENGETKYIVPNSLKSVIFNAYEAGTKLDYAFYDCISIDTITLFGNVESIGEYAFYNCASLKNFVIPASVTSIGSAAFAFCNSISQFQIASGNTSYKIDSDSIYTMDGETLVAYPAGKTNQTFNVPANVKHIGDYAFAGNKTITAIELPTGLETIGIAAFLDCSKLTAVTFVGSNTTYLIEDGVVYNPTKTIIYQYFGTATELVMPDSVVEIKDYAFYKVSGLTKVVIGKNVTTLGEYAFGGTSAIVEFAEGAVITTIGDYAFSGYMGTSITLPDTVTTIGEGAFQLAAITSFNISDTSNLTTIGEGAFIGTAITAFKFTANITEIADMAFALTTSLKSVTFIGTPALVSIGDAAFAQSAITSFPMPATIQTIGVEAFYQAALTEIDFTDTALTTVGAYAFWQNQLNSIKLSSTLTSMGEAAFGGNAPLSTLIIPEGVEHISRAAFSARVTAEYGADFPVSALTTISIPASVKSIGELAFYYMGHTIEGTSYLSNQVTVVFAPGSLLETVEKQAFMGTVFNNSLPLDLSDTKLKTIGDHAFRNYVNSNGYSPSTKSILLPETLESIGVLAFYCQGSMEEIRIPHSVKTIAQQAFSNCNGLKRVYIGDETNGSSLVSVGANAFQYVPSLDVYMYGASVPTLEDTSFTDTSKIYVPTALVELYKGALPSYASRIFEITP